MSQSPPKKLTPAAVYAASASALAGLVFGRTIDVTRVRVVQRPIDALPEEHLTEGQRIMRSQRAYKQRCKARGFR